jgi:hypothetical protein
MAAVLVLGLGIFAVRFHHYFAAGATSTGARFDYWRAAAQTTAAHPWLGTGPGTFQRPYAQLKSPTSEMARLAHNDYLEQFSDSGIPGGLAYGAWIFLALAVLGRQLWPFHEPERRAPSRLVGGDCLPTGRDGARRSHDLVHGRDARQRAVGSSPETTQKPASVGGHTPELRFNAQLSFAIFLGLLGWFAQGLGEFGLFVPALAWTAFTLLGCLLGKT